MRNSLKKFRIFIFILLSSVVFSSIGSFVGASSRTNIYLFYSDTCAHCAAEEVFLKKILPKYPNIDLKKYEVTHSKNNVNLLIKVADKLNVEANGVPFLVVGDKSHIGYSEDSTPAEITKSISQCSSSGCTDVVAQIIKDDNKAVADKKLQKEKKTEEENKKKAEKKSDSSLKKIIKLPLFGEIDALDFSLPLLAVVMGGVDGFNPCAMWVLLFLISLLLGFENRKKMWVLGGTFILASAFVYFLFMVAWLKLFTYLSYIAWIRIAIGLLALTAGFLNIKKGLASSDGGCDITGSEKRQETFKKLRKIVNSKSFFLAFAGIILLAFAVNLVELACSLGFPATFVQVLTMSKLASWQYYGYILLYILFFMLDDIVVFIIAMVTLKMTGLSTKYSKWSSLLGGAAMVIIGILLVLKPEWLSLG